MSEYELISLFKSKNQSISSMWSLYVVVSLGVFGFVLQKKGLDGLYEKALVTAALIAFFVSSLVPMYLSVRSLHWLSSQINLEVFVATSPYLVAGVHIFFDSLILLFIWKWPNNKRDIENARIEGE